MKIAAIRARAVYKQFLLFVSGLIHEQPAKQRLILAAFSETIGVLLQEHDGSAG